MFVTTALLALAIAAVWLPSVKVNNGPSISPALLLLGVAVVAGLVSGLVEWGGVTAIVILLILAICSRKSAGLTVRRSLATVSIAMAFALGTRLIPGFTEVVLIQGPRLSPDASPVRLTAHFDVGVAGLVLVLLFCRRSQNFAEAKDALLRAIPVALITTGTVIALACFIGYVRPDFKLPWFTGLYLAKTLLWTAVLEEGFFRGIIQEQLASSRFVMSRPSIGWLPIAVSSVIFGLAHARGGWTYVFLASLAGVGYGVAYSRTGRIEASIFTHFFLNSVHFIGFTYPCLEGQ